MHMIVRSASNAQQAPGEHEGCNGQVLWRRGTSDCNTCCIPPGEASGVGAMFQEDTDALSKKKSEKSKEKQEKQKSKEKQKSEKSKKAKKQRKAREAKKQKSKEKQEKQKKE